MVCMHMIYVGAGSTVHLWRSEDNLVKSVLSTLTWLQGLISGCQTCVANAFTHRTIPPALECFLI